MFFCHFFCGLTKVSYLCHMQQGKYLCVAGLVGLASLFCSCRSHYSLSGIERTRILVDSRYDAQIDNSLNELMAPYKHRVDSIMSPVVGQVARYMAASRPESELSNLLADILVWAGKNYGETPDMGLYNIGGIRAALAKGDVTAGDVLDVAPFENKIAFVSLKGDVLMELFEQMAGTGGEAVSHGVQLVFTADKHLKSARLNGEEIDLSRNYRVATIDYLTQGNDHLEAFLKKTQVNSPQEDSNNLRYIIMDYFREQMKKGIVVDREIEGRIVIEP